MGRKRVTENRFQKRLQQLQKTAQLKGARFPDDTPEKQLRRKAEAVVLPEKFNEHYLGHYFRSDPAKFHPSLYLALELHRFSAVRAPRGHAKSTVLTFAYPLRQVVVAEVLKGWEEGTLEAEQPELYEAIQEVRDAELKRRVAVWELACEAARVAGDELPAAPEAPKLHWDPYIQIIAVTTDLASEFTEAIKVELEENELIRSDWGELVSDPGVNYEDFVSKTDVRLKAFGMTSSIRGGKHKQWRPTLALIDDPDSENTVGSEKVRDKQEKKLTSAVSFGLDPKKKRVVVIGTPLHSDCLVVRLTEREKFAKRWFRLRFKAICEDGTPQWPAVWSVERLREEEQEDAESFAMEMMDTPPTDGDKPFPVLHYYERGPLLRVKLPKVMAADPALGKTKKSDYQALAVLRGPTKSGKILVHRIERWRISDPLLYVQRINDVYAEEDPDVAVLEAIGFQVLLEVLLRLDSSHRQLFAAYLRIERQEQGKDMRIRGMAPLVRQGVLVFPDDESCIEGERDFRGYPHGKVDVPDVVEMAVRQLRQQGRAQRQAEVRHIRRRGFGDFGGARSW